MCPFCGKCATSKSYRWPATTSRPFGDSLHHAEAGSVPSHVPCLARVIADATMALRRDVHECRKLRQLFLRKNQVLCQAVALPPPVGGRLCSARVHCCGLRPDRRLADQRCGGAGASVAHAAAARAVACRQPLRCCQRLSCQGAGRGPRQHATTL
jgi:hypothetical protein